MKSGKQRKAEIKQARLDRIARRGRAIDPFKTPIPKWAVPVNADELVHHSMFVTVPLFYVDKAFDCKDCGVNDVWTAKQQKWWYEIAKGDFETTAIRCRRCRKIIRDRKAAQRKHMDEVANRRPHPNEAFFKKK